MWMPGHSSSGSRPEYRLRVNYFFRLCNEPACFRKVMHMHRATKIWRHSLTQAEGLSQIRAFALSAQWACPLTTEPSLALTGKGSSPRAGFLCDPLSRSIKLSELNVHQTNFNHFFSQAFSFHTLHHPTHASDTHSDPSDLRRLRWPSPRGVLSSLSRFSTIHISLTSSDQNRTCYSKKEKAVAKNREKTVSTTLDAVFIWKYFSIVLTFYRLIFSLRSPWLWLPSLFIYT